MDIQWTHLLRRLYRRFAAFPNFDAKSAADNADIRRRLEREARIPHHPPARRPKRPVAARPK
jgi:hypothetical protein